MFHAPDCLACFLCARQVCTDQIVDSIDLASVRLSQPMPGVRAASAAGRTGALAIERTWIYTYQKSSTLYFIHTEAHRLSYLPGAMLRVGCIHPDMIGVVRPGSALVVCRLTACIRYVFVQSRCSKHIWNQNRRPLHIQTSVDDINTIPTLLAFDTHQLQTFPTYAVIFFGAPHFGAMLAPPSLQLSVCPPSGCMCCMPVACHAFGSGVFRADEAHCLWVESFRHHLACFSSTPTRLGRCSVTQLLPAALGHQWFCVQQHWALEHLQWGGPAPNCGHCKGKESPQRQPRQKQRCAAAARSKAPPLRHAPPVARA